MKNFPYDSLGTGTACNFSILHISNPLIVVKDNVVGISYQSSFLFFLFFCGKSSFQYCTESKKSSPMHVAPACAGSAEEFDHFGSFMHNPFQKCIERLHTKDQSGRTLSWLRKRELHAPGCPFYSECNIFPCTHSSCDKDGE